MQTKRQSAHPKRQSAHPKRQSAITLSTTLLAALMTFGAVGVANADEANDVVPNPTADDYGYGEFGPGPDSPSSVTNYIRPQDNLLKLTRMGLTAVEANSGLGTLRVETLSCDNRPMRWDCALPIGSQIRGHAHYKASNQWSTASIGSPNDDDHRFVIYRSGQVVVTRGGPYYWGGWGVTRPTYKIVSLATDKYADTVRIDHDIVPDIVTCFDASGADATGAAPLFGSNTPVLNYTCDPTRDATQPAGNGANHALNQDWVIEPAGTGGGYIIVNAQTILNHPNVNINYLPRLSIPNVDATNNTPFDNAGVSLEVPSSWYTSVFKFPFLGSFSETGYLATTREGSPSG